MSEPLEELRRCFAGSVCVIGLGHRGHGDDGLGVRVAEQLEAGSGRRVIVAGMDPERYLPILVRESWDHVVFVDAVDFGALPGSVIWLGTSEILPRFPQVSTHKLCLGLLAKRVESNGWTRAWLLGVQPESVRAGTGLSSSVQSTIQLLTELLGPLMRTMPMTAGGMAA